MKRSLTILCLGLAGAACQPRAVRSTPEPRETGGLYLYLRPLPRESHRLEMRFRSVEAQLDSGPLVPLDLQIVDVDRTELGRERLLASGHLPPGRYVALNVAFESAALRGAQERVALSVADEPTRVELAFTIGRGEAVVAALGFEPTTSRVDAAFRPSFRAEVPGQLAVGLTALATSRQRDTVTFFDKVSGSVSAVVPTGRAPAGMALARERLRAYVAISGDDSVEVIDIVERRRIDRLQLDRGDAPLELALSPDGGLLLSANSGSDTLSFIDPLALFEVDRLSVGNGPTSVLIDPTGQRGYVFNTRGDSVTVVDLARRTIVASIRTDSSPLRGDFSPDGDLLYVVHQVSPYLLVIDPATLETINRVYIGAGASALKVDDGTGWIYVARRAGGGVEIYDPSSLLPIGSIATNAAAGFATIDGEGNNLFLAFPRTGVVTSFALAGQRSVATIDVGDDPYWLTLMGER